jgi:transketolase
MKKTMRDAFLEEIYLKMQSNDKIYFLSADFGAPALDKIRSDFPTRFINVGIAEQNLINVATGLALEGFCVYAYAIAPFITMRCYEQIRVNLAILSQLRDLNVNIIGVGAGFSYDMSGPTHHCLEDLNILNTLANIEVFSPSDYILAKEYVDITISNIHPKYIRFDAKPLQALDIEIKNFKDGFRYIDGKEVCIISTGFMSQKANSLIKDLKEKNIKIGLIDLYLLKNFNKNELIKKIKNYKYILTMQESFLHSGGLDSVILNLLNEASLHKRVFNYGVDNKYTFEIGDREYLHQLNGMGYDDIYEKIIELVKIQKK